MKTLKLLNYARDSWVVGRRRACRNTQPGDRRGLRRDRQPRPRFQGHARPWPPRRRPGAAAADLPPARLHAEGPRQRDHGAQGGIVRAQLRDRRDPDRRLDRHRRRRRHALLLLLQGPARAAQPEGADRRRDGDPVARRHLRRPARLHPAAGRRRPYQRLQLPGLGHAREARADPARGRAGDREAGLLDRLSRRSGVPDHDRGERAADGGAPVHRRIDRRPARPSDAAGRRLASPARRRRR